MNAATAIASLKHNQNRLCPTNANLFVAIEINNNKLEISIERKRAN